MSLSTGATTALSDNSIASSVDFVSTSGATFTPTTGYVLDQTLLAVLEVDLATGVRTELSGTVGTGPGIESPNHMALDTPRGRLLLAHAPAAGAEILAVDTSTGNRSVYGPLSSRQWGAFNVDSVGRILYGFLNTEVRRFDGVTVETLVALNRPSEMAFPSGLALLSDDRALMTDNRMDAVFDLDLVAGTATVVSRSDLREGEPIYRSSQTAHLNQLVFIADDSEASFTGALQLDRIDLTTRERVELTGDDGGDGTLPSPSDIEVSPDGATAWWLTGRSSRLVEVDVATGAQALIATDAVTGGPLGEPDRMAVDVAGGVIYLLDTSSVNRVLEFTLSSSTARVIASDTEGSGATLSNCNEIALDGTRLLIGCDDGVTELVLATGVRTQIVSGTRVKFMCVASGGLWFYSSGFDLWRVEGSGLPTAINAPYASLDGFLLRGLGYDATLDRLTFFDDWRHSILALDVPTGERVIVYR